MQIRELLDQGAALLAGGDAQRESALLLRHVLSVSDAWLVAHADDAVDGPHVAAFLGLVERRAHGEPVAYLTGRQGFHAIELRVTPSVLIPRPETELLVELALARIPDGADVRVADLGTGSGAIALALAKARPRAHVLATDVSEAALEVAHGNAARLDVHNVDFEQRNWFAGMRDVAFDVIVSNPPYVAAGDPYLHEGDLRFEPPLALSPGSDGLGAIRVLVRGAWQHLSPGGWLLLEHGFDQGPAVRDLLLARGYANVFTKCDLEGRERVSGGSRAA